jgi:hypothetical protein
VVVVVMIVMMKNVMKGQVDRDKKEKSNGDDEGAKMTMMGKKQ